VHVEEERQALGELLDVAAAALQLVDVGQAVGQRVGHLLDRRGAGVAHVRAGDADGIEARRLSLEYRIVSAISRIDGRTGKIQVPRATYSFRMSFWIVPVSLLRGTPCLSATARYIA
jgi:hypothetical protein